VDGHVHVSVGRRVFSLAMAQEDDPLLVAAREGRANVVKKLLAKGVEPRVDSWKQTALHLCAIDGHVDVAELLLAHGIDPNARNKSGDTALLIAADMFAGPAFFRLLLEHGADASVRDKEGESAIDKIFSRVDGQGQPLTQKRISICKLLIAHGAPADPDHARRVGAGGAKALKAKAETFDWAAIEAHLLAASTKAIAAFAKHHAKEVFYGFCFDCNAQSHGDVLCCLDTVKPGSGRVREEEKWSPGDWEYQEFANMDGDRKWRALMAPLGDENGIEPEIADRLLESIARVAVRLLASGAFAALRRTDNFDVFVLDHEETFQKAKARMKRARAGGKRGAKAKRPKSGHSKPVA